MKITEEKKRIIKKWSLRAAVLLPLVIIVSLILGQYVFATGGTALRTVHKVSAGDKTYCFSVQQNVVLSVSELSEIEDDEALAELIMDRAGLFMRETGLRCSSNPVITMEEWLRDGNTLALDKNALEAIKQAVPEEGKPVKFHLDVFFTLQYDEDKANEEKADTEEPSEEPTDPADPADPAEPSDPGTPSEPQDPSETAEPSEQTGNDGAAGSSDVSDSQETGDTSDTDTPEGQAGPEDPSDPSDTPDPAEPSDPTDPDVPADPDEPADPNEPGDPDEPVDPAEPEDEPFVRPVYSTYKMTFPELLFVVIATDEDAAVTEEECDEEPEVPVIPEEPEMPEIPEMDIDIPAVPQETLPEYRKIDMPDKSKGPLPSTLEDGEPVELQWIEPDNSIDVDAAKEWIERFPGGKAGFGGACGLVGLIAAGIAAAVIKKRRDDDY